MGGDSPGTNLSLLHTLPYDEKVTIHRDAWDDVKCWNATHTGREEEHINKGYYQETKKLYKRGVKIAIRGKGKPMG